MVPEDCVREVNISRGKKTNLEWQWRLAHVQIARTVTVLPSTPQNVRQNEKHTTEKLLKR